jgi:Intracellular hyaluronan-binding protein 4 N-terminal
MENTYGIGVTNRYALFLDEEGDPLDILKQSETVKTKKVETAKPVAKGQPAAAVKKEPTKKDDKEGKFLTIKIDHFKLALRRNILYLLMFFYCLFILGKHVFESFNGCSIPNPEDFIRICLNFSWKGLEKC